MPEAIDDGLTVAPGMGHRISAVAVPAVDLATVGQALGQAGIDIGGIAKEIVGLAGDLTGALRRVSGAPVAVQERPRHIPPPPAPAATRAVSAPLPPRDTADAPDRPLGKAERLVLSVLAQYPQGRTKTQVALLTGYASSGGGFNNAISALRSMGYLEGGKDQLVATPAGMDAIAGSVEQLPTGTALLDHWLSHPKLGKAERLVLSHLHGIYPSAAAKEEVAQAAGYEPSGGGFNNAISRLRTLELITGPGTALRASEDLF